MLAVIGLNNPNAFCIGDTIYTGPKRVFPGIPSFSPELFCYMRNPNPSKYKQFVKGLNELLGEGAVQVIRFLNLISVLILLLNTSFCLEVGYFTIQHLQFSVSFRCVLGGSSVEV